MSSNNKIINLIQKIADIGQENKSTPPIKDVSIFKCYFTDGKLKENELDETDGTNCTRRELITRYLFLNAVLDQGPDIEGVRILLKDTLNLLYKEEIRILHNPIQFFNHLNISVDNINHIHKVLKDSVYAENWAKRNDSDKGKYNLFMDNSKQTLNYAIFRWGMPLAVILLLQLDKENSNTNTNSILLDYLENDQWYKDNKKSSSAENMSTMIKTHPIYGLGKAIGDKGANLFAKWIVNTFPLTRVKSDKWGKYSHEIPFDSNVGRVLFRTGFFTHFASIKELEEYKFIINDNSAVPKHIRITNIRNKDAKNTKLFIDPNKYSALVQDHLAIYKRNVKTRFINLIPITFIMDSDYSTGDLDDGLIHIGTTYCHNNENPKCCICPISQYCEGNNSQDNSLITDYRT